MIYRPTDEDLLDQQNAQLQEDDPAAHRKIQAATRDTEPTIQLILAYDHDGRDFLDPELTDLFNPDETPDVMRLRKLLNNEVSISHRGCVSHYVNQPVPTGWRKSGMLRQHRLFRVGPHGESLTDDRMIFEHELGVIIRQKTLAEGK